MFYGEKVQIEDLRNHSTELVAGLHQLLRDGAEFTPDLRRTGFYEIANETTVYYVCKSPAARKILLLATWPTERALSEVHAAA